MTADASGNVRDEFNLPDWFVATYSVKATGSSGSVATTSFTDANVNAKANLSGTATTKVKWTLYNSTDCTGTAAASGPVGGVTLTGSAESVVSPANKDQSLKLTAEASSSDNKAFDRWTDSSGVTLAKLGNDATTTCQTGFNNGQGLVVFTANYVNKSAAAVSEVSGSGTYGGSATLKATLKSGTTTLVDKTVEFKLDGNVVCGVTSKPACPKTNSSGVAELTGVSLSGKNAGGPTGAGYENAVSASFAGDSGYNSSSANGNLSVAKAPVTVKADNKSRTYGDANPALTASYSGFVNNETSSVLSGSPALSTDATAASPVKEGGYAITTSVGTLSATNYSFVFENGTLTVDKAILNVKADAKSKTYGDADLALTHTLSGFKNDEDKTTADVTGDASCSIATTVGPNVGEYADAIGCAPGTLSAANYSFASGSKGTLTIDQRPISVTADDKSKTYGETDPVLTYKLTSGTLAGTDGLSGSLSRAEGNDVGSYDIRQGTLSAGGNYNLTFVPAKLTITQKEITVTPEGGQSKVYGSADPEALTFANTPLVGTDGFSGKLGRAAGENAGSYAINLGDLSAGSNYELKLAATPVNFEITKKQLMGSFTASNKVYDGNANAEVASKSLPGVIGTEDVTLDVTNAKFDNKNVANDKDVSADLALSGEGKGNYALSSTTATAKANITPLGVTGSFTAEDKVYDGNVSANVTGRSLNGAVAEDKVTLSGGTASFDNKNAGIDKAVTLTGATLAGEDKGNYTLGSVNSVKADITLKALTGNFTAESKVYDGNDGSKILVSSVVVADKVEGDEVSLVASNASAKFGNKNVGTAKTVTATGFALGGADAGNYSLSMNTATADIVAKELTGSFTASNKVYDGNTSATITGRSLNGDIPGDNVSLSGGTASFGGKNVGTAETVTATGFELADLDKGNYTLTSVGSTTANITAKELTGSFTAKDKVYDGNDNAEIGQRNLNGTIQGDDVRLSGGTASFGNKNVGTAKTVTATGFELAGLDKGNYTLAGPWTASANITPKPITVTADAKSKVFGAADPALTYQVTNGSLVQGDSLSGNLTRLAGEVVGTYAIQQGTLSAGDNYGLTYVGANLTIGAWTPQGFHAPIGISNSFYQAPGGAVPAATSSTVWQTAKGGSTVPLKFNVFADGVEKTSTADVKGFNATKLSGCSGTINDAIDESVLTAGSTSLRYDTTEKQFIQNWKTSTVSGDACYRVTVTLQDDTRIHTFVKLRK